MCVRPSSRLRPLPKTEIRCDLDDVLGPKAIDVHVVEVHHGTGQDAELPLAEVDAGSHFGLAALRPRS